MYRVTTQQLSKETEANGFRIYAKTEFDFQTYEEAVVVYDEKKKILTLNDWVTLAHIDILGEERGSQELQAP